MTEQRTEQTVDLRPDLVHFLLYRGDGWRVYVECFTENGTPEDLTNHTITGQIRSAHDETTSTALTITPDNLATGKFWAGQNTAAASGVYDVQVENVAAPGTRRTKVAGTVDVYSDVTSP